MQLDYGPLNQVLKAWQEIVEMPTVSLRELYNGDWRIQILFIETEFIDERGYINVKSERLLDECVEWAEGQLITWPKCRRSAWDMWDFKQRKDAEKFITLFHLSWPA